MTNQTTLYQNCGREQGGKVVGKMERVFTRAYGDRTRDNSFKQKEDGFRLDTGRHFCTIRVVRH